MDRNVIVVAVFILVCSCAELCCSAATNSTEQKVCLGTSHGLAYSHNGSDVWYRRHYRGCTHVYGNLEIVFLDRPLGRENVNRTYNLTFLSSIREVSGYVLIVGVYASSVPLHNLRIIRGQSLYTLEGSSQGYSLYVAKNYQPNAPGVGLQELQFTSLHEIMDGSVMFHNNYALCHEKDVNWNDILTGEGATVSYENDDANATPRACLPCDDSCKYQGTKYCWGDGPTMCQRLTRNCSRQCDGTCFGPTPQDCCHPECVGGCSGPAKYECWGCRNFINGDNCVQGCPPPTIYKNGRLIPNPAVKYVYGTVCVAACPEHMITEDGACVSNCGDGKYEDKNGKCVPCDGPCPKTCESSDDFINANNIDNFIGCTVINGVIKIAHSTLQGGSAKAPSIRVGQLSAFENVREITGALMVEADHPDFVDLSFFRNLHTIYGRRLYGRASLHIAGTGLTTLGLQSLSQIRFGNVILVDNAKLCFANAVNWNKFFTSNSSVVRIIETPGPNASCASCSSRCSADGCWGPTDSDCVSCARYKLDGIDRPRCVDSCVTDGFFPDAATNQCKRCHEECKSLCSGPGADECSECRNVQDGDFCVSSCPITKYVSNKRCLACSENCVGGCSGPVNAVGSGGCNYCDVIVHTSANATYCQPTDSDCPDGYYNQWAKENRDGSSTASKYLECKRCHPTCLSCHGPGLADCRSCSNLAEHDVDGFIKCVDKCSDGYYYIEAERACRPCHSLCQACTSPAATDCTACRYYKVYRGNDLPDDKSYAFECVTTCPETAPKEVAEQVNDQRHQTVCVAEAVYQQLLSGAGPSKGKIAGGVVGGVIGAILLCGAIIVVVCYLRLRRTKSEEKNLKIHAQIYGVSEMQPLVPSGAQPDMAQMRIVKESELKRLSVIGSGAFGTVYKGTWIPPEENVKIVVAIKVLKEGSSASQSSELLDEARIMASVIHPHCARIIAVCLTSEMMLIMPFMAYGCLLDYVRKNQASIGSQSMLNWASQIAKGMEYLESRGIVHRDLAARNVLVHSENNVKITDFGLAKLLDVKQEMFQAEGGKMPVKWLALECIHHRIFTHKSDVWSYGVTLWEMFSYGLRPYENIPAYDIPEILEKGERLPQPTICTIDVYMIMIKCWLLDAACRPSFKELGEIFLKMSSDPSRYLVIHGDDTMRVQFQPITAGDLLIDTSAAEGSEEIISADEYLQPKHWAAEQKDDKKEPKKKDSMKKHGSFAGGKGGKKASGGGLESCRSDPNDYRSSSRYIADPTMKDRNSNQKAAAVDVVDYPSPTTAEDDYLQPAANPAADDYLDPVINPTVSNPEYFERDVRGGGRESEYINDAAMKKVKRIDTDKGARQRGLLNESAV